MGFSWRGAGQCNAGKVLPMGPIEYHAACPAMIDAQDIQRAVDLLLNAAPAGSEVILFGSYARGDEHAESDLDFLVIEPHLPNRHQEMVRLRQALRPLRLPVDVLVVSREGFEAWKDLPNNVVSEAAREGRSFARAA